MFDSGKMRAGVVKACEKRPIETEKIDKMMINVEEKLRRKGKEISSEFIGGLVAKELKKLDKVAYIRFASVYKDFTDIGDFREEIKTLLKK